MMSNNHSLSSLKTELHLLFKKYRYQSTDGFFQLEVNRILSCYKPLINTEVFENIRLISVSHCVNQSALTFNLTAEAIELPAEHKENGTYLGRHNGRELFAFTDPNNYQKGLLAYDVGDPESYYMYNLDELGPPKHDNVIMAVAYHRLNTLHVSYTE